MSSTTQIVDRRFNPTVAWRCISDLLKLRVNAMVALTAACGAYFGALHGSAGFFSFITFKAICGISLAAAGTAALNQVMERDTDALMKRTCMRPLITGTLSRRQAVIFAVSLLAGGLLLLAAGVDFTTSGLTILTAVIYLLAYTPLKMITPICTSVGAVAGAMPPLIGYRALAGRLDVEAVLLFAILFAWQFPHFHSIALLYRDDYATARVQMLAVVDVSGHRIARSATLWSVVLMVVSTGPFVLGYAGPIYLGYALGLGTWLIKNAQRLRPSVVASEGGSRIAARQLLRATLFYLPALLIGLVLASKR